MCFYMAPLYMRPGRCCSAEMVVDLAGSKGEVNEDKQFKRFEMGFEGLTNSEFAEVLLHGELAD